MEGKNIDFTVKVVVIGDSGVGKTNLITRFCDDFFKNFYVSTIGVDFKIKNLEINDKKFKMQIWDTAGQERFRNIAQTYYKSAAGIILAYSICDKVSFGNIEKWMQQIDIHAPENAKRIIVALKKDLEDQRKISTKEGETLAAKYGIPFIQVSSKQKINVQKSFQILGAQIEKSIQDNELASFRGNRKQVLKKRMQMEEKSCAC